MLIRTFVSYQLTLYLITFKLAIFRSTQQTKNAVKYISNI